MKTPKKHTYEFLKDWRFWLSLIGALFATILSFILSFSSDSVLHRYGPGSAEALLAFAGFYAAYTLAKGKRDRLLTAVACLCGAFLVFWILAFSTRWWQG